MKITQNTPVLVIIFCTHLRTDCRIKLKIEVFEQIWDTHYREVAIRKSVKSLRTAHVVNN